MELYKKMIGMQCSWETCEHHEHVLNEFEHLCIRVWPHFWMQSVNAITLFTECIWFCLDFFVLLFIILWGIWMLECAQCATVAKCVLNCTACVPCVVLYIHTVYVHFLQTMATGMRPSSAKVVTSSLGIWGHFHNYLKIVVMRNVHVWYPVFWTQNTQFSVFKVHWQTHTPYMCQELLYCMLPKVALL